MSHRASSREPRPELCDSRGGEMAGRNGWRAPLVSITAAKSLDLRAPNVLGAASPCYRSEVGSAGCDVHGLYRVHQFAKVEQVVICQADMEAAEHLLQQMTANAEELLQLLAALPGSSGMFG